MPIELLDKHKNRLILSFRKLWMPRQSEKITLKNVHVLTRTVGLAGFPNPTLCI